MRFAYQLPILIGLFASVANAQYVQLAPAGGVSQTVTQQPGTSLNVNVLNNEYVAGQGAFSTIQAAINAAGTTGIVIIPANYPVTDSDIWSNPNNIRIVDERPYNPTNNANYQGPPNPQTTVKAADYGAICDGVHDDTANIQAAVNALTTLIGGAGGSTTFMGPGAVELPQGRCEISSSIVLTDYGSLLGSPGGTWIYPLTPWSGSDGSMVIITSSYSPSGSGGLGHGGGFNRQVSGIAFEYNYNATAHTAIKVVSGYGHTTTTPYPSSNNNPQSYQIQNVTITGNYIFAMDTGIDLEDCGQCNVYNNYISFVRLGIWNNGNDYAIITRDNSVLNGSASFTPTAGSSYGILSQSQNRYYCNGGTGSACTGGSVTTVISSPQDLGVYGTSVESNWTYGGYILNALGFDVADGTCFCDSTTGLYLGKLVGVSITNSTISTSSASGNAIEIAAPASNPPVGLSQDNGWWIDNDSINTDNHSTGTATGIMLDSGSYPLVNLDLSHNQFFGFGTAVKLNGPLTQSRIIDNYGDDNATSLIVLNASGANSFGQTVISNNTSRDSIPILTDTAGSGYILGYNSSPVQWIGTQVVAAAGCTITAGAVGNKCSNTITFSSAGGFPMFNTSYRFACTASGGVGTWTVGNGVPTDTTLTIPSVALSATATGGGYIACTITSVQ